jgi:hypothetical protein
MPDPFNITQVDIPGIYGAVRQNQMSRIQQMLGERQIAAADRQAERENHYNTALTRLFTPPPAAGASSGASGSASPTPPVNPVVAAYGGVPPGPAQPAVTPPGLPGADPAGTAAPSQMRIDPAAAQALIQADPERGPAVLHAIRQMNADQLSQAHERLVALAPYYAAVAQIHEGPPYTQRRAYIQSILPQLQQMGLDPAQITGFDPSDQALNQHMLQGETMEQILVGMRPDLHESNGQVIDYHALPAAAPGNPVVYTDPILNTGAGPFLRSSVLGNAGPQPPQAGEVRQTSRGPMRFRGGDYRNPANYEPVQGGAPPPDAAGTFPRQDGGAFDFNAHPTSR